MNLSLMYIAPIILLLLQNSSSSISVSATQPTNLPLLISCGLQKSTTTTSLDNRIWKSDEDATFTVPDINTISSIATATDTATIHDPPYDTARLFQSSLTYIFSLSPGPKFVRLYFTSSASYNNISPSQFFLSLQANQVILFKNFSPLLNSPIDKPYEFHLTVEKGGNNNLNLTFSPGNNNSNNRYGFINAIEIVPVPEGLYNLTKTKYITSPEIGYQPQNITALQTLYRLNVGGVDVTPTNDSGNMSRSWKSDLNFLVPGSFPGTAGAIEYGSPPRVHYTGDVPTYVAPELVYATERVMGGFPIKYKMSKNITWRFEVDAGFDYLMRLHFCEMDLNISKTKERVFNVYINSQMADSGVNVWERTGGFGIPMYLDYIAHIEDGGGGVGGNGTKVYLWLALHPDEISALADVILNGLEIFKLSEFSGNSYYLAAPNPQESTATPPTILSGENSKNHSQLPVTIGAIGGTMFFLFIVSCFVIHKRRAKNKKLRKKSMVEDTPSKNKWVVLPSYTGSTTSTVNSSLPTDLCRCFSQAQIKVATCDFDKKLIIGRGGFGTVYMGSIEGETTTVAIKRLNSTSKQGTHEFQTEIVMLSRLRHVHLVSLIGYCKDRGEMILVYEYMPRGTLRDHLLYKNSDKNQSNDNIPLSWKQRLKICLGSARGLHYLHAGAKQLIIHRDVKSTNILLDDNWMAKVSDFGLSKVGPDPSGAGSTHISTAVKGSVGYLDPEYYRSRQLTEKSDVYSFGVVLFEVLCARAVVKPNLPKEQVNLAMWARSRYKSGMLHTIVDPNIRGQIASESLRKFGEIADMCVSGSGSERPSMGDVVWGLEFALQLQEIAERNINAGDIEENSITNSIKLTEGDGGIIYNDSYGTSENDFSRSSNVVDSTTNRLMDTKTSTSNSLDYPIKSGSVFSEIIDPRAR